MPPVGSIGRDQRQLSQEVGKIRALVTGSAGFIGSHLAERLVSEGHDVVGVDRFSDYYEPARKRANLAALVEHESFELIEADLATVELGPLVEGAELVFHLAAQPGVRASWGAEFDVYIDDNVKGTQRLLEALQGRDLSRLVYASSSSIYGDAASFPTAETDPQRPISPYGVTKLAAEHLCWLYFKMFDVPAVSVRYFTIFGPRQRPDMAMQRFIESALAKEAIPLYGSGEQQRDFTYVADAVAGTLAAATRGTPGASYNISGGNQASVLDVIATLEELLDRRIEVDRQPFAPGDAERTGADTSLAAKELGYEPKVTLREGLERQVAESTARAPNSDR